MDTASGKSSLYKLVISVGVIVALTLLGWAVLSTQTPALASNMSPAVVYAQNSSVFDLTAETRVYPASVRRCGSLVPSHDIRSYPVYTRGGSGQASTEQCKPPFTFIRTH
jgi:hypothetical protein